MQYVLKYKKKTLFCGTVFECLAELKEMFSSHSTLKHVIESGWSIKRNVRK